MPKLEAVIWFALLAGTVFAVEPEPLKMVEGGAGRLLSYDQQKRLELTLAYKLFPLTEESTETGDAIKDYASLAAYAAHMTYEFSKMYYNRYNPRKRPKPLYILFNPTSNQMSVCPGVKFDGGINVMDASLGIQSGSNSGDTNFEILKSQSHKLIVFTFRGTASAKNILVDLMAWSRSMKPSDESDHDSDSNKKKKKKKGLLSRLGSGLLKMLPSKAKKYMRVARGQMGASLNWHKCPGKPKAHDGFVKQYEDVRGLLMAHVSQLVISADKYDKIIITGHSMGAAFAEFAALDIALTFPKLASKILLYPFASPKIGNKDLMTCFETNRIKTLGFQASKDPVPKVPFWLFKPGPVEKFQCSTQLPFKFCHHSWFSYAWHVANKYGPGVCKARLEVLPQNYKKAKASVFEALTK